MDLTESIIPRSDQINADDLIAGPITYTVRDVIKGAAEHPFDFLLVETDRAYRPSKTMRRVIVNAWGPEAANYAGRRLTLYREPSIKYAGVEVGGIRISHMSHIEGPVEVMAQTTRGKRETFVVLPLQNAGALPAPSASDHGEGENHVNDRATSSTEPASAANAGGLCIDSVDAAARVIRAMSEPQLRALKVLLDIKGTTTKAELAATLYGQRIDWFAEDILREIEGLPA